MSHVLKAEQGGEYAMRSRVESEPVRWSGCLGAISAPRELLPFFDLLDHLPLGIGLFDSDGRLFHSNQHFERAAGGPLTNLNAMSGHYWRAVAADGTEVDQHAYPGKRALLGQTATPGVTFNRKRDCGSDHWVTISAIPLTLPDLSVVSGVLVICEDINFRQTEGVGPPIGERPTAPRDSILADVQLYLVSADASSDLSNQIRRSGGKVKIFETQRDLIDVAEVLNPGCVIVDLRGIAAEPLMITDVLRRRPADLQIIFIGAAGTSVDQAMQVMRAGAIDYLIEPLSETALADAIQRAGDTLLYQREELHVVRSIGEGRLSSLSRREREVLTGLVSGGTNKMIARTLQISPRTVEVHRAHLMERLNARNLTELLHIAHEAGLKPSDA